MRPYLTALLLVLALPALAAEAPATPPADGHSMPGMEGMGDMQGMSMPPAPAVEESTLPAPAPQPQVPTAALDRRGNEELQGEVKDGVREFQLTTGPIIWPVTDTLSVNAMAYNGQVPGPLLRVTAGEKIRVVLRNNLSEPTTIHWHGVDVPPEMDGVPGLSQPPVPPGGSFTYEFTVPNTPGTFFYHTHVNADRQQALGLSGAFIIMPKATERKAYDSEHTIVLGEWTLKQGGNVPSMPMEGMFPNLFTLNGKAYPATETISAKVGERVLFRLIGAGAFSHPIHLHGAPFKIVAVDGHPVPLAAQLTRDTITVNPGERYDLLWTPNRPGTWMLHCHINHHTMGDGAAHDSGNEMGGMIIPLEVSP